MTEHFEAGNLDDLTRAVVGLFPELDAVEQHLSLELYRLLAAGKPVPRVSLADRLEMNVNIIDKILDRWPAVFSDSQRRVVGYWGLSIPSAQTSAHQLTIDGRRLFAWCAWDTLFLPELLGKTAEVESASPTPGATVRLTVTPEKLVHVEPAGAEMSFFLPKASAVRKDLVSAFCCYVHFFPSSSASECWTAQHPGTFRLSIEEAYALARRKNEAQYRDTLRWTRHAATHLANSTRA